MRFHRLELNNINSLYGDDHVIDFDSDLNNAPLYLIMGPTGSGKSTLLDAICLALFGKTPRQRGKNRQETAEAVMSRKTGECWAALEFSRLDPEEGRVRYRAKWYCHRARKNPKGNIQFPRRSLERWEETKWKALVSDSHKKKDYEAHFRKALAGVTLDDFLRSILLAQGDFTAFLDADEATKADILEKLTDADDYVAIGQRAMDRWRSAKKEVDEIETRIDALDMLDGEAFEALKKEEKQLGEKAAKSAKRRDALQKRLQWRKTLTELQGAIKDAGEKLEAAEKAKEARSKDTQRLERAKRARPLAPKLARLGEIDEELEGLVEELEILDEEIEEAEEELGDKESVLEEKKESLDEAKEKRKELDEEIKGARQIRADLKTAKQERGDAEKERTEADKALEELDKDLGDAREAAKIAEEEKKAEEDKLEELADHEGIVGAYAGLEARTQALKKAREEIDGLGEKIEKLEKKRSEQIEEIDKLGDEIGQKEKALETLQSKRNKAKEALQKLLKGADDAKSRDEQLLEARDEAKDKLSAIDPLFNGVGEFGERQENVANISGEIEGLGEEVQTLRDDSGELQQAIEAAKKAVEDKTEQVRLRRLPVQLAEKTQELQPDTECPVCGSTEHPYRVDPPDIAVFKEELQEAEKELEAARKELGEKEKALRDTEKTLGKKETQLEERQKSLDEKSKNLAGLQEELTDKLEELDIAWRPDTIDDVKADLKAKKEDYTTTIEELEEARETLDDAQGAFRKADDKLKDATGELKTSRQSLTNLKDQKKEQTERLKEFHKELESKSADFADGTRDLSTAFGEVGIEVDETANDGFKLAIEEAEEKKDALEKARKDLEKAKKAFRTSSSKVDTLKAQRPGLKDRLEKAEEALEKRDEAVEKLEEKASKTLDGRDPDKVEEELTKAIDAADKAVKKATKVLDKEASKQTKRKTSRKEKKKLQSKLRKTKKELSQELDDGVRQAEFDSIEELREAVLDEENFQALEKELKTLDEAINTAKTTFENKRGELKSHEEKRPAEIDEELTVEDLGARLDEVKEEADKLQRQLGAMTREVEEELKKRGKAEELEIEEKKARQNLDLWTKMQKLIGTNHGEDFKQFAQALNLENIVYYANRHLTHLNKRYRLAVVRDESEHPQLNFEIIDDCHPDRARGLSTLSGGETFLVSLALALALADFRQLKMPVETLLLDEGFGTLDQSSLNDAIKTLKSLHAENNRQVGVISHVEQLQERIDHRVVLEKQGGGRSTIAVETPETTETTV